MIDDVIAGEGRIISLMDPAKLLGTSYPTVHRMACNGELKVFKISNTWRTSAAARLYCLIGRVTILFEKFYKC